MLFFQIAKKGVRYPWRNRYLHPTLNEGDTAVYRWIDSQLHGTSVTVVLIGSDTLNRPFVQYEIRKSLQRGNALIGVHIHSVRDMRTNAISPKGNAHTIIGHYEDSSPAYFDEVCDAIYDYVRHDGYANLGTWIENAAKAHNK